MPATGPFERTNVQWLVGSASAQNIARPKYSPPAGGKNPGGLTVEKAPSPPARTCSEFLPCAALAPSIVPCPVHGAPGLAPAVSASKSKHTSPCPHAAGGASVAVPASAPAAP